MGLRDSLSGVSDDLGKILTQLKDIENVQKNINKGASSYAKAVTAVVGTGGAGQGGGGGRASNGTPQPNFSTPPPAPGSALGGVTSSSAGHSTQTAGSPGTSSSPGWARAAALTGAAAVTYGYNVTPGVEDVFASQRLKFRASFLSPGGYNANYYQQSRRLFGEMQTDPFGMMTAANIATMTGNGMGTGNFSRVMRETATTSAIFGMDNASSMMAQAGMNSGNFAGRMAKYGIFVSDMSTGSGKGLGSLVDQIWSKHYGSSTRKIPYESVAASIRGGWLGLFLNKNFGDVPELREQVTQALLMKAKENGDRLDFSDLGPYGSGAASMPGARGTKSAMGVAVQNGLTPENDPGLVNNVLQGSRADVMDSSAANLLEGYRFSAYSAANINKLVSDVTASGNAIVDFLLNLKGALQGFSSIGELSPLLGFVTGGPMGAIKALFAGGGGVQGHGSSTSDSISARLSKGEYVVNARAVQAVGAGTLDAINALGHPFGSAYASPTKNFAGGGLAGSSTLDGWTAVDYGDKSLRKYAIPGAPGIEGGGLMLREADGIGEYLAAMVSAWQAHPALGGGRANLNKGWSGGHSLRTNPQNTGISNHSAGVAVDLRADIFPLSAYNMSKEEVAAVKSILQRFSKIEWGGDWTSPVDQMHFEIRDPETWGSGSGVPGAGTSTTKAKPSTTDVPSPVTGTVMAVMGSASGGKPQTRSVGAYTGGARGLSLGIGSAFSWVGQTVYGMTSRGGISPQTGQKGKADKSVGSGDPVTEITGNVGSGSGPEWLYSYLVSKGLRGSTLQTAWVIGMRESSGNPNLQSKDRYGGDWNSSGPPHYDVGLYQINNRHLPTVQKRYGGDMRQMLNLENNYDMTTYMSGNWSNLLAWALEPDGQTFNWSHYNPMPSWAGASMANHRRLWGEYDKYNTQNYSEGAWRTHEGMAKLHEGEMVLPATVAEQFREAMRSAATPGGGQRNVNITLNIEKASDEDAERFARKVKQILDEDEWSKSVRRA